MTIISGMYANYKIRERVNSHDKPLVGHWLCPFNKPSSLDNSKKLNTESTTTHYPNASAVGNDFLTHNFFERSSLNHKHSSVVQNEQYSILPSGTNVFMTNNT